ncbi:MAG: hypothetical protein U9Q33_02905 [Campylobacterota bacterium]|nr:hypothetical protein [Campylobacterota bacterium]
MSLKENVEYVKEEISTQESFIENFFKLEKFFNKYKKTIIGSVSIIIMAIAGLAISDYNAEQNKIEANEAFNTLLESPENKQAQEILKSKNKKLYHIAMYMNQKSSNVETEFLKELTQYSQAIQKNDTDGINRSAQDQKFILKDFAIFNKALIEAKKGDYKKAKETLRLIPETSGVEPLSKMLAHYLLTK